MRVLTALLPVALLACQPSASDDADAQRIDLDGGAADMRPAMEWDTGDAKRMMGNGDGGQMGGDGGGGPTCLAEGAMLRATHEGDPIEGLEAVRADFDPDGDGAPDLLLTIRRPDGLIVQLVDGRSLEQIAGAVLPGAATFDAMPGLTPTLDLITPITVAGVPVYYGVETRPDGVTNLLVMAADDLSVVRTIPLANGLRGIRVMANSNRWFALVDDAMGGCAIHPLEHEAPLDQLGGCHVQPGWDANGDGQVDVVRAGVGGLTILDGNLLEPIASNMTATVALGFAPAWADPDNPTGGPLNLRGMGPEVVAVGFENNQLILRYLDPIELNLRGDPQPLNGRFIHAEFRLTPDGLRLLAHEERSLQNFLHILAPGDGLTVPRRGDFGGFRHLRWGDRVDIDEDGVPEVVVYGGAHEEFHNTDVVFASVADATEVWTVRRDGPARLDAAWLRQGGIGIPADIDGCPGAERVFVRSGATANDGTRPTRVLVYDDEGDEVTRSEGFTTRVHQIAVADLDGDGIAELLEVRSDGAEAARLRVYARRPE